MNGRLRGDSAHLRRVDGVTPSIIVGVQQLEFDREGGVEANALLCFL